MTTGRSPVDRRQKPRLMIGSPSGCLAPTAAYRTWRNNDMSDRLPMWIELRTDFSDAYLEACGKSEPG
jgi:hypothetical protein